MSEPLLAALAGALVVAGVLVAVAGATGAVLVSSEVGPAARWRARALERRTLTRAAVATAAALAVLLATGWPVAALATAAGVLVLPMVLSGSRAKQRIERLEGVEAWARQLADSLTTDTGLEEALLLSADDPPPAIAAEVSDLARQLRFRTPTADALHAFADRLNEPVGDMVVAALLIASTAQGAGLHVVLTDLARTVARTVQTEREIHAERATHRTTVRWVVVALVAFTLFTLFNTEYVRPYATIGGQLVLALVAALYATAIWWLHRLASPAPGHRFLPPTGTRPGTGGAGTALRGLPTRDGHSGRGQR